MDVFFFCITGLGGLYLERLIHEGAYFQNFMLCHVICYHKEHAVCWAKNSLNKVTCIIIYANLWK